MIDCTACGLVPVPDDDLPVRLPDDVSFDQPGNPLDRHPTWKDVACPDCRKPAARVIDGLGHRLTLRGSGTDHAVETRHRHHLDD